MSHQESWHKQKSYQGIDQSDCVYLNFENLNNFEPVRYQFQQEGIVFSNALALQPSNSAYPPRSGRMVLMGAPRSGWLEATFEPLVSFFECYVTSSQRTVLSAYGRDNSMLATTETGGPNLQGSDSEIPPHAWLKLEVVGIYRITLYAFDGQFTVDDLAFGI